MQESLRSISRCALTAVIAPMDYGKATAVNWYLAECAKAGPVRIVRISVTNESITRFLCALAGRLPANVHLIVASRDRFLPAGSIVRLGNRVCQIGTEQLRLNHTELSIYAHRCGAGLSDAQVDSLLYSSEGWFSAVYLNFRTLSERGALPDRSSDIYTTFTAAMIDPLPEKQREFLAVVGLADEFTVEMARFVTGDADAERRLSVLTAQSAFCVLPARRRDLSLSPHDEGVCRAYLPDAAGGAAGALPRTPWRVV